MKTERWQQNAHKSIDFIIFRNNRSRILGRIRPGIAVHGVARVLTKRKAPPFQVGVKEKDNAGTPHDRELKFIVSQFGGKANGQKERYDIPADGWGNAGDDIQESEMVKGMVNKRVKRFM